MYNSQEIAKATLLSKLTHFCDMRRTVPWLSVGHMQLINYMLCTLVYYKLITLIVIQDKCYGRRAVQCIYLFYELFISIFTSDLARSSTETYSPVSSYRPSPLPRGSARRKTASSLILRGHF